VALNVLAYNIKRVMAIIGGAGLLEALATRAKDLRIQMDANRRPRERYARPETASRKNVFSRASSRRCGLHAMLIRVFLHSLGPSRHFACA
jgi:hypothetical protein